jgi:hypothetical protein
MILSLYVYFMRFVGHDNLLLLAVPYSMSAGMATVPVKAMFFIGAVTIAMSITAHGVPEHVRGHGIVHLCFVRIMLVVHNMLNMVCSVPGFLGG